MRIACQQTILMKYHAVFFFFKKNSKIRNCLLLQIIGGAIWVNIWASARDLGTYIIREQLTYTKYACKDLMRKTKKD